ncbi:MAG: DUF2914 domain-containing protein [Alphaproteobacteria bacterium]|nr:DUF2914 domain-containing protein [Alphaproteobacteria bacterium]
MTPFAQIYAAGRGLRPALERYKHHLSAASMVIGFGFDNVLLGPVDIPSTQLIIAAYLAAAAAAIGLLHLAETAGETGVLYRWRNLFPMAIQFALGSVWSGLLVFYSRSAVIAASWPFLLLLLAIFIGNEVLRRYVAQLVFSTILLFFAVFSYAIFLVPIYVHAIGTWVFMLSGALAVLAFVAFLYALAAIGPAAFAPARLKIMSGTAAVFALINLFYFVNILPPLPLALADSGVYHAVKKVGDSYVATAEGQNWYRNLIGDPVVHLKAGEAVYAYSSVFAPIRLSARISHRWEWYSEKSGRWLPRGTISFTVNGGRNGGYRGYTIKHDPADGDWRVDIETRGGNLIGRIRFRVEHVDAAEAPVLHTLAP